MVDRRTFLGMAVSTGASLALTPQALRAIPHPGSAPEQLGALRPSRGNLLQRAIPSTGEMLPVIGLGARSADNAALKKVLETLVDRGGKVVDTLHGGPAGEQAAGKAAGELRIQDRLFWATALAVRIPTLPGHAGPPPKVEAAAVRAQAEAKMATLQVKKVDLFQVMAGSDIATHLAVLREMKKEGLVRYIGVSDLAPPPQAKDMPYYAEIESIMRNEAIDFIGVDYSVGDRRVEEKILPLAQERRIGVMAYFTFDRSRIFRRASATPLPDWAAEFDATTWAQFFLKYVVSHPAVTVARTGTTKADHMLDNLGAGIGRLPDEAMRKRMAQLVDSLPATPQPAQGQGPKPAPQAPAVAVPAAVLDRYVGEFEHTAAGTTVGIRRDGERLLIKSGTLPEAQLVARTETRFGTPWASTIEFQLDGQGKVSGAVVEQGPFRIPLARK